MEPGEIYLTTLKLSPITYVEILIIQCKWVSFLKYHLSSCREGKS